jgi:hypothetical protein
MCIIWNPFQVLFFKVDGAGYTIVLLSVFVIIINLDEFRRQKTAFATKAFRCWVILLCYSMINVYFKGFHAYFGVFGFFKSNFFNPFILLVIIMMEMHKNKQRCLKALWIALTVYLIIGFAFLGRDYGGRAMVGGIGNLYPLHAVAYMFVTAILYVGGKFKTWFFVVIAVIISLIILGSGTRKAFGVEVIIIVGVILNHSKRKNLWFYVRLALLGVVMLLLLRVSLKYSMVGMRLEEGAETIRNVHLVSNQRISNVLVTLLDDRASQYEKSLDLFRQHFFTGIGVTNYMDRANSQYRLHSEYMVQLCENGIVGFILLIVFYVRILIALKKAKERTKSIVVNMMFYGLAAVMFLDFTCWTYNQNFVMIIYAILLIYANPKSEYCYYTNTKMS